jgi:hypothetical protein
VEEARVLRIRSGAYKRERAQQLITKGPDVLDKILSDERSNARHKIDAVKALDDLSGFAPERSAVDSERVIIHIDMGADVRAKGLASDPADVLHIEAEVRPDPNPDAVRVIDAAPQQIPYQEEDVVPLRRGPGRPRGSRNKPKVVEERPKGVPGFILD